MTGSYVPQSDPYSCLLDFRKGEASLSNEAFIFEGDEGGVVGDGSTTTASSFGGGTRSQVVGRSLKAFRTTLKKTSYDLENMFRQDSLFS
jgi:hypothetical protein